MRSKSWMLNKLENIDANFFATVDADLLGDGCNTTNLGKRSIATNIKLLPLSAVTSLLLLLSWLFTFVLKISYYLGLYYWLCLSQYLSCTF
ncbi:hypothetical protein BD408DRAFT_410929 [Parasitella parasitica]|nr:hypothetical protein BD408DRAFT_410929 [Parasitella parasitica]